ncbi:unnamed protein product, partial [Prorocentrum cordatum]
MFQGIVGTRSAREMSRLPGLLRIACLPSLYPPPCPPLLLLLILLLLLLPPSRCSLSSLPPPTRLPSQEPRLRNAFSLDTLVAQSTLTATARAAPAAPRGAAARQLRSASTEPALRRADAE